MDNFASDTIGARTHVFILRVWCEAPEAVEHEVRIQVRQVPTGETRYFLEWPALAAYLTAKLNDRNPMPDD